MDSIPKSVRIAIAAASRDILDSMRGAGVRVVGNPKSVVATMEKFMTGMVTGAYAKSKSSWVDSSIDNTWVERSAASDDKNLQTQLAEYLKNNESVTKDMLIEDTGADASLAHQLLSKFFTDRVGLEKENPDLYKVISDMVAGSAPSDMSAPAPLAAPSLSGGVSPIPAPPPPGSKVLPEEPTIPHKGLDQSAPEGEGKIPVRPIDPSKFNIGHPTHEKSTGDGKTKKVKPHPVEIVPEEDQFTGSPKITGKEEGV
jgi:hypothetical protein